MNAKQEIISYIEMNENPGALLLTGEWGCGKTYLIKEIAEEYKTKSDNDSEKENKTEKTIVVVSLFGISSVLDLQEKVKRAVLHSRFSVDEKASRWIDKGISALKNLLPEKLGSLFSVNPFDLLDIDAFISPEKLVLVFDDFERCSCQDRIALLGCINDYIESKRIKVIIVANEEKVTGETNAAKYHDYKEKVICRTINLSSDFEAVINSLIEQYKETANDYSAFLSQNRVVLYNVFSESGSKNIRLVKYIMADFERIYAAWEKTSISDGNMPYVLYTFAADYFWSRQPKEDEDTDKKSGYRDRRAEKYSLRGERNSIFYTIGNWLNSGEWDEDEFIVELNNHYGVDNLTPEQGFLWVPFWEMEQKYIDEGMPIAIDKAYRGELSHDDLASLLQKIWGLRNNEISLPCDVDYDKILDGYQVRLNRIKSGDLAGDRNRSFAMPDQIEEGAKPINVLLEKTDELVEIYNNRRKLLNYVRDPRSNNRYRFGASIFAELDDEMVNAIWEAYSKGDNQIKLSICKTLDKIRFFWNEVSDVSNLKTTQTSYNKFMSLLNEAIMNNEEEITKRILQATKKNVQERAKEIDEEINKLTAITNSEKKGNC